MSATFTLPVLHLAAHPAPDVDPCAYDRVVVAFSGGKDSIACVLHLLECGVHPDRIELWHHDVDGREGSRLMDWACTPAYVRAFAAHFGLRLYFSWKVGGFEREMLRENARTAPIAFEVPGGGVVTVGGGRGGESTRRKFPQVSADLSVRWCSVYLKVHVGERAICNQPRFLNRRTLFVTGERAQESAARSRYAAFAPHTTDNRNGARARRHVDHWRAVHSWTEAQVWAIMERWRINPHPAYRLGFGRVSCAACIFLRPNQWAALRAIDPGRVERIAAYEAEFGCTIHRKLSVYQQADAGKAPEMQAGDIRAALSVDFTEPVQLSEGAWRLPAGAFGENAGPI